MRKSIKLNGSAKVFGDNAEVRELTVGEWLAAQTEDKDCSDSEVSFRMLARMLYVDGQPIGWEKLMGYGLSEVQPALDAMGKFLIGEDLEQGEA